MRPFAAAGLSAELRRLSLQMPDGATQLLLAEDRGTGRLCGFARFSQRLAWVTGECVHVRHLREDCSLRRGV